MRNSLRLMTGVAPVVLGLAMVSAPVAAQEAVADDASDVATAEETSEQVITVTGSRIRLPNLESAEPTTTIDSAYIEQRNFVNVADAINDLPQIRGSVTPNGGQSAFGQGVNFINNFGLGSNRTLTLINGRRVVSSNTPSLFGPGAAGLQVDTNIIPTALVERIDIVSIGGAPTYGSDAISGTLNFILKDNYEGLSLNATSFITEEGDNFTYRFEGVYGTSFAEGRGNVTFSLFYTDVEGVLQSERDFFRDDVAGVTNSSPVPGRDAATDGRLNPNIGYNGSTSDGFPGTVLARDVRIPFLTRGGLIFGGPLGQRQQFDSQGNLVPFTRGNAFPGIFASGGDGFRFSDYGQLTSDLRRFSANVFANYDLTDNINLFLEAQYYDARADELVQQPTFNTVLFGGASAALNYDITNPFLTDQARGVLSAAGVTNFTLSRVNTDLADLTGFAETEFLRAVGGLRGDFTAFGDRSFNWEASFNYGQVEISDFRQDINVQNFVNAVNVGTDANGNVVCTTTPSRLATPGFTPVADSRCVPLNLFGEGVSSQAARDYITADNVANNTLEQWVVNLNVGGSLFDVWGGPVGFNIGYEHRNESAKFIPSQFEQDGLGRGSAVQPVIGGFNLDEVFGEVLVPLISKDTGIFIDTLELFGRVRYVDNTVNGGFTSWAAGGRFAIIPDVEFRGNFTRSFRAPAVGELFLPQSNAFGFVPDLCAPGAIGAGPVPDIRTRNCNAFLAQFPTATPLLAANASVPIVSGGNPNLENEQADSYTFGAIIRPRWVPNLAFTVDYVDIDIAGPISSLTVAQINSGCFDNTSFNLDDPANGNSFCSLIRRQPDGQVVADPQNPGVRTGFVNGQQVRYKGIQGTMTYSTGLDALGLPGNVSLRGDLTYVRSRLVDITGVAPQRSDGTVGDPEFAGQFTFLYNNNNWGFGTTVNYTGEQLISRNNRGPSPNDTREFDQYNDYVVVDSNLFLKTDDGFRFNFVVNNVFNRQGQSYFGFLIPGSINDAFGRSFSLSVTKNF